MNMPEMTREEILDEIERLKRIARSGKKPVLGSKWWTTYHMRDIDPVIEIREMMMVINGTEAPF